jgi:hypothetical protein
MTTSPPDILHRIGGTPLLPLRRIVPASGARVCPGANRCFDEDILRGGEIDAPRRHGGRPSTTIPVSPEEPGCLRIRPQPETADIGEHLGGRGFAFHHGRLDDGEELALQRPMVPLGPLAQPPNHVIGRVLDQEVDGHGSRTPPFRSSLPDP